jgi:hypothetical protein
MRLTNNLRDAILRTIMDDVPFIEYDEQIKELIQKRAVAKLPPLVKRVYDDAALRGYLKLEQYSYQFDYQGVDFYGWFSHVGDKVELTDEDKFEITRLETLSNVQASVKNELRSKVSGILRGMTTTQAFVKALPEFEKYVPKDQEATKNLPALANLVSDFVKAGWPKGKAKLEAEVA